jgi:hypothetical protein
MANIRILKSHIESVEPKISAIESTLKANPENFAMKLELASLKNQLNDLRDQLYKENIKREKEVVELRLIGEESYYGSLPLNFVGGLTNNFASALHSTSRYLKYGRKGGLKRDKEVKQLVDLRLEGIGKGSTIFYISGRTSPDMFGYSIFQNTLENTFSLFASRTPDDITNNIGSVGVKSIKYISRFLYELKEDNLEVDLKWNSPDLKELKWEGKKDTINNLFNTLNQVRISEPEDIHFEGELITISSKGRFEIQTRKQATLFGHFSSDLLQKMKEFHIGDYCQGIITKTLIYNPLTDKEKVEYNLTSIS